MDDRNRSFLTPLKVYCTKEQRDFIKSNAKKLGISASTFMLRAASNSNEPLSVAHLENIEKMLKINADMGRLGGLIKLWLTNDKKTKLIGKSELENTLFQIVSLQNQLVDLINQQKKKKFN